MEEHETDLMREVVARLAEIDDRLDRLEPAIVDKLNQSYQQGVADACKTWTGRDPKVADDA
jgi:hypothetical protein